MRLGVLPRLKRSGRPGQCRGVSPPIHTLMRAKDRQLFSPPPVPGLVGGQYGAGAGSGAVVGAGAGAFFGAALRFGAARFADFLVVLLAAAFFAAFFFLRAGAAFFLLAFLRFFAIIVLPLLAASGLSRRPMRAR